MWGDAGLLLQGDWAWAAQLQRSSAGPRLEGRAGRHPGGLRAQRPPAPSSPWGKSALPEEPNRGRKDLREFWHLGFPEEKANSPWPLHSTTQPLSGAAEANRALDPPLTDGLKAQSEGASDRADLPRHQRNKSNLREKEPGDRDRKTTCTSHNITHSETREHGWNPWSKNKVLFKDKDK